WSGVVAREHDSNGAGRHRCVLGDRQTSELLGNRLRAKVIGLGGLHLATRNVAGVVVADVARLEPLVGQHLRYGGGQSIDVGVVDHVDGGFIWRVSQLLGLAFVLVV